MIFESHSIHHGKKGIFNIQCAYKLFAQMLERASHDETFADCIKSEFVKCQMTKLKDLECSSYFNLKFVEFLEFMCQLSLRYAKSLKNYGVEVPDELAE